MEKFKKLIVLVAGEGFEPSTFRLWAWRATRLLHPAIIIFWVFLNLFTQKDLLNALEKAERRLKREKKEKEKQKVNQTQWIMNKTDRHKIIKMLFTRFFGGDY